MAGTPSNRFLALALAFGILGSAIHRALIEPAMAWASRSAGGTYSLPTGNPVSSGATISSTVHNNTMSDLATEMTDSLNRSGKGAMLAPLRATNGTVSAPSITFDSDQDVGLYRIGSNNPAMSVGNALGQSWSSTGATFPLGAVFTESATDTDAITSTGNGVGAGINANGGTTSGAGAFLNGGAPNGMGAWGQGDGTGIGLKGTGGDSDGTGVQGVGGATNGLGVQGAGSGTGAGGSFASTGTGYGVITTGNATRANLRVVPQSAEPSSPQEGDIYYDSDTDIFYGYSNGAWRAFH